MQGQATLLMLTREGWIHVSGSSAGGKKKGKAGQGDVCTVYLRHYVIPTSYGVGVLKI